MTTGTSPMTANRITQAFRCAVTLLAAALIVTACSHRPHEHHEQLVVFGTLVDITIFDADDKSIARASAGITADLNRLHRTWHAWETSTLTAINDRFAHGEGAIVDAEGMRILRRAQELSIASGGLFNPAVGKLIGLWGFHQDDAPKGPPPPAEVVAELVAKNPQMSDLTFSDTAVTSGNPDVQLDLGAFAKGYAVDRAIGIVRAAGIENAIVNAGGDLRAIGRHGGRPWRIGIRNPGGPGILASVEVTGDESVFTSGNYERYFDYEGTRYHHIIDPRSGYPADGATSVTVIHTNGATADAAATALLVAGPEHWANVARQMGIENVMLVDKGNNIHMTLKMAQRVQFEGEAPSVVIVADPP
ncbi:MAG: thiamine biosynthesis lipoprotein [Gammaproteobacteria bacterium]|nr:MAG: thiamine biosynthesis lipoprotein [Gammaproteobacteria bacterium]TND05313.1 MAG: thiamine biosynthesis lipoprotein [Gammaproteobacteria bacterium]